jgi:hypothetical protein
LGSVSHKLIIFADSERRFVVKHWVVQHIVNRTDLVRLFEFVNQLVHTVPQKADS